VVQRTGAGQSGKHVVTKNNLFTQLKNGRKLSMQIMKRKLGLVPPRIPLRIDLNVTKECNLSCRHCYASLESVKHTKDPSFGQIKDVIDDVYAHGCRWFRLVGGEPLLRDDIGEIAKYARKKGMFVEISTNGLLVKKRIKELKEIDAVCVSLDGSKETNDFLRGKGTYEKIVEGLEIGVKSGLKMRLHCVLTSHTISSLKHMVDISKKYDVNMNFGEIAGGNDWEGEYKDIAEDELIQFYDEYEKYKRAGVRISNSFKTIRYARNWRWKDKFTLYEDGKCLNDFQDSFKVIPCKLGRLYAFIDVDGGMYPCTKLWKHGINYYEEGFGKAWKHLGSLNCLSCREMSSPELSLILSGNVGALLNGILRFA